MPMRVPSVNVDRVNRLIHVLKSGELAEKGVGFNMGPWISHEEGAQDRSGHSCGTVACLGGTIDFIQLFDLRQNALEEIHRQLRRQGFISIKSILNEGAYADEAPYRDAGEWLGLNDETADIYLFQPDLGGWNLISMNTAIRCLEILRDELTIDWERAAVECGQANLIY